MTRLRRHLTEHRRLAAALLALALALRALVPAGYMPAFGGGTIGVRICEAQVAHAMPHGGAHGADHRGERSHADQPCAFAGLSAPADPPADFAALPTASRQNAAFASAPRAVPAVSGTRSRPPARAPPFPA